MPHQTQTHSGFLPAFRLIAVAIVTAWAIASLNEARGQISYSTPGSLYSENFNSLPTDAPNNNNIQTGTGAYTSGWQDNTTTVTGTRVSMAGWYLYHPITQTEGGANGHQRLRFGPGSSTTGAFYGFASGGTTDSEKALGSLASNTMADPDAGMFFGLRLRNDTGATLDQFTLTYDGEQWRNGGSGTANTLQFDYSSDATEANWFINTASYASVAALNFTAPVVSTTAGLVDGNAAGRVTDITATVSGISWAPGADLWLRWTDLNGLGSDDGLAVDNFRFSAVAVVPEPSTWAMIAVGFLTLFIARRRWN
jgi:hypothetical protein